MAKERKISFIVTTLSLILSFIIIFPILWLLSCSFKPSNELFSYPLEFFSENFTIDSYVTLIKNGFLTYVGNSFKISVVGTILTLIISSMAGYALSIYRNEISYVNKVFAVFLLGTLIPGDILTVPQFSVISALGLYNNFWGVVLPVITTTTGIFMYRQHYMSVPLSLVEAARIDGANEYKIFASVMLPLGKSTTITLTIFSFIWRWNDYILPLMVLSSQKKYTIQVAIKSYIGQLGTDWQYILAGSIISIVPVVLLFICLQKYITGGIATSGIKG